MERAQEKSKCLGLVRKSHMQRAGLKRWLPEEGPPGWRWETSKAGKGWWPGTGTATEAGGRWGDQVGCCWQELPRPALGRHGDLLDSEEE